MNDILLLGAGFSKNWDGWLATEFFNVLVGKPLNPQVRELLFRLRKDGGFEATLAKLQGLAENSPSGSSAERNLSEFQEAIASTFHDMDQGYIGKQFEFQNDKKYLVRTFLAEFDAIYTLNQDLLLERFYLNENIMLTDSRKWDGWSIPGMMPPGGTNIDPIDRYTGKWRPDPAGPALMPRSQPIIKLHGSINWFDQNNTRLLIVGGNKPESIDRFAVLKWNFENFRASLMKQDIRLTIIGYGFRDAHINAALLEAARRGGLSIFLIDPNGLDALDTDRPQLTEVPGKLMSVTSPHVKGISQKPLRQIFGGDVAEHAVLARFRTR